MIEQCFYDCEYIIREKSRGGRPPEDKTSFFCTAGDSYETRGFIDELPPRIRGENDMSENLTCLYPEKKALRKWER